MVFSKKKTRSTFVSNKKIKDNSFVGHFAGTTALAALSPGGEGVFHLLWGFPKIGGKPPKMDGENNGKPLFTNGWFGGTIIFRNIRMKGFPPFCLVYTCRCVGGQPVFSLQFGAQCCYHWPCCTCLAQGSEKCPRGDGLEADQMLVVLPNPVIW